jgi:hypothetical protein
MTVDHALDTDVPLRQGGADPNTKDARGYVLGWLREQGLPANVARVLLAGTSELAVSEVLQELGVIL